MSAYIEPGYVEPGYVEGDNAATQDGSLYVEQGYVEPGYTGAGSSGGSGFEIDDGKVKLKFFVLRSTDSNSAISGIQNSLASDEAGVLYAPASKKFFLVEQNSFTEFVSQIMDKDQVRTIVRNDILLIEHIIKEVLKRVDVSVKLIADGVEIVTPQIEHNGTEFSFKVPPEYSGLEYKVVLDLIVY